MIQYLNINTEIIWQGVTDTPPPTTLNLNINTEIIWQGVTDTPPPTTVCSPNTLGGCHWHTTPYNYLLPKHPGRVSLTHHPLQLSAPQTPWQGVTDTPPPTTICSPNTLAGATSPVVRLARHTWASGHPICFRAGKQKVWQCQDQIDFFINWKKTPQHSHSCQTLRSRKACSRLSNEIAKKREPKHTKIIINEPFLFSS